MVDEERVEFVPASDEVESIDRLGLLLGGSVFEARFEHLLEIISVDLILFDGHVAIDDVASFGEALGPGDH